MVIQATLKPKGIDYSELLERGNEPNSKLEAIDANDVYLNSK